MVTAAVPLAVGRGIEMIRTTRAIAAVHLRREDHRHPRRARSARHPPPPHPAQPRPSPRRQLSSRPHRHRRRRCPTDRARNRGTDVPVGRRRRRRGLRYQRGRPRRHPTGRRRRGRRRRSQQRPRRGCRRNRDRSRRDSTTGSTCHHRGRTRTRSEDPRVIRRSRTHVGSASPQSSPARCAGFPLSHFPRSFPSSQHGTFCSCM